MGKVSDYVRNLIAKQVHDHGLVVWFDPGGDYRELSDKLAIPDATVVEYDGSLFALRREIEPYLKGGQAPRLVVYVPMDEVKTHGALIEAETAGVVMKPGQQPPERNTRLSVVARDMLSPLVGQENAAQFETRVEQGKLSLSELDKTVDRIDRTITLLSTIFGSRNLQEIALAFLSSDRYDKDILSKDALDELSSQLQSELGIEPSQSKDTDAYRALLARYVLATDLLATMKGSVPKELQAVKVAGTEGQRELSARLAKSWRNDRGLRDSYVAQANRVEKELGLAQIDFTVDRVSEVETFLSIEELLQDQVEAALLSKASENLVKLAEDRLSSFWSEYRPEVQARWALAATAGRVFLEANGIARELKAHTADARTIFKAYTEGEHPWCLLDTYHRYMEQRYYGFEFDPNGRHTELNRLIASARQRYNDVGSRLAETFVRRYQEASFRIPGILLQTAIFETKVKPRLAEGKVAYVWVDALRYEMAADLAKTLVDQFDVQVEAALGAVPTITEIGMAALLPGAQSSPRVVSAGGGKLALELDGVALKDRKGRVDFLKTHAGVAVSETKLEDLLPSPKKKVRDDIAASQLVLVTSQEIDALYEGDNIPHAVSTTEGVVGSLRRGIQVLGQMGVKTIVFTADHGYLFGEDLGSEMLVDAPGGDTVDLHRRVWVGHGGTADPAFLRAKLADFGFAGDLEVATPWSFAGFKVPGGALAYFHGGLSPEEVIIPVVTLAPKRSPGHASSKLRWELVLGSPKISTRFFSVQIQAKTAEFLDVVPPKVRVELRVKGEPVSQPVAASCGFEEATGDVQLKLQADDPKSLEPNTVTLMVRQVPPPKTMASVHVLDAASGADLAHLDNVEVSITV